MLDLKRTNDYMRRRGERGRLPGSSSLERQPKVEFEPKLASTTFTAPDIILSIFAHAQNRGQLVCGEQKITQRPLLTTRPSYGTLFSQNEGIWETRTESLSYLAPKTVTVTGPRLGDFDIKALCRLYPFLRSYFFGTVKENRDQFSISLDAVIREMALSNPRDYYRAAATLSMFLSTSLRIESESERLKHGLEQDTPFLASNAASILAELNTVLNSPSAKSASGSTLLMSAAKGIKLDLAYTAIETMFLVGSPQLIQGFLGARKVFICNLTHIIAPDCPLGQSIGLPGIRALAVTSAFAPYYSSDDEKPKMDGRKSKSDPLKVLNLEAIAVISGRHKMFHEHYGMFVERVLKPMANLVGELIYEAKSNLHILFHQQLTTASTKVYEEARAKFMALKNKILGTPTSSPAPEAKPKDEPIEPKNSRDMLDTLIKLKASRPSLSEKESLAFQITTKIVRSGMDFLKKRTYYDALIKQYAT